MLICKFIKGWLKRFDLNYSSGMCDSCKNFYTKDINYEADGDVKVFWFPRIFSQSHFGDRTAGSNACTLIVLLVAYKCYESAIKIEEFMQGKAPSDKLICALAESIVEGNDIHETLLKSGRLIHINLTVPEAMIAAGSNLRCLTEWKSLVYMMDMRDSLHNELTEQLSEWNRRPPDRCGSDLFIVLIAENRSVLLIFQKDYGLITMVDSHQHLPYGAVMAQVPQHKLASLCYWYHNVFLKFYGVNPDCYELSYLYFKRFEYGEMAGAV